MKKYITSLCFAALVCPLFAQWLPVLTGKAPASGSNITADFWQTFENATLNATNLAANDHAGGLGTWSVVATTDPSTKCSTSATGETHTLSTVNSTADTGTLGLAYSLSGGTVGYVQYSFSSAKSDVSIGFWYTTATPGSFDIGTWPIQLYNNSQGGILRMADQKDGGDNTRELQFVTPSATVNMTTGIANATKYWISIRYVQNGTGKIAIYDSSGVQQGTTTDIACGNFAVDLVNMGNVVTVTTQAQTVYFDDWVMNWTAPTNTIGP